MIYRVCEHYYNDETIYNINNYNECLVCLEYEIDDGIKTITLKNYLLIKSCNCDAWIHESCLELWLKKNNKCPICRIEITKKNQLKEPTNGVEIYSYSLFMLCLNFMYFIIKFTFIFSFFYYSTYTMRIIVIYYINK